MKDFDQRTKIFTRVYTQKDFLETVFHGDFLVCCCFSSSYSSQTIFGRESLRKPSIVGPSPHRFRAQEHGVSP